MLKKAYRKHKETAHNFFWRVLQMFVKQGILFAIFYVASVYLRPDEFGIYNYILAIASLLLLASDFGISTAAGKYVAEYQSRRPKNVPKIFSSIAIISLLGSLAVTVFILIFGHSLFGKNYIYILLLIPYIFFIPLVSIMDGIYRGLKKFRSLSLISMVAGLLALGLSFWLIITGGLTGAVLAQSAYGLILMIGFLLFLPQQKFSFDKDIVLQISKYAVIIGISGIAYYFYSKVDILILKYYNFVDEIGYYEVLNRLFYLVILPFGLFGQAVAPDITKAYATKKYTLVKSHLKKSLLGGSLLAIIVSLAAYLIIPLILNIFFPQYYTPEIIYMFSVLIWILPIRMVANIVSQGHTISTGNAHFSLWALSAGGLINVILDFVFIDQFGFIGIIYSTVICFIAVNIVFISLYYHKLNRLLKKASS